MFLERFKEVENFTITKLPPRGSKITSRAEFSRGPGFLLACYTYTNRYFALRRCQPLAFSLFDVGLTLIPQLIRIPSYAKKGREGISLSLLNLQWQR